MIDQSMFSLWQKWASIVVIIQNSLSDYRGRS